MVSQELFISFYVDLVPKISNNLTNHLFYFGNEEFFYKNAYFTYCFEDLYLSSTLKITSNESFVFVYIFKFQHRCKCTYLSFIDKKSLNFTLCIC